MYIDFKKKKKKKPRKKRVERGNEMKCKKDPQKRLAARRLVRGYSVGHHPRNSVG
jgi:hypothetical protein